MRGEGGRGAPFVQSSGGVVKAEPRQRRDPASWNCAEFVFAAKNQQDLNIEPRSAGSSAQEMHI